MKSNVVHNPALSATFNQFVQEATGYVASQLAPAFHSGEQASWYYVFGKENILNIPHLAARAPATPFARTTLSVSDDTYYCKNYGHETPVADEERKKYANAFNADEAAVRRNASIILFNHEKRVKKLFESDAIASLTPTAKWNDYTNTASDPVGDIKLQRRAIQLACGKLPDTLSVSQTVYDALSSHPKIRAQFYANTDGIITADMLRKIFEVEKLLVAGGIDNLAAEGQPLDPGFIWGDTVVLAVTNPTQDLSVLNAARTFVWNGGSGEIGSSVETYRSDTIKADIHRSLHYTGEKLTGPEMAFRFDSVLTD
jgi:hypothetical protein